VTTPSQWAGLEMRHLLALRAIAEQGSFHKAATHLDYTQSGISQQIAALERIVGGRLIERPGGSRPVRLTAAGEVVLRHARAVFGQISGAQVDIAALREGKGGALRVGAFQSVGATILPPLLRRLAADRPDLRIELTQTTSDEELFVLLADGRLDLTFAMLPIPAGPFVAVELFGDPFVVMTAPGSTWARGGPVSVRELVTAPLIAATHGCRYIGHFESYIRERGHEPTIVFRSDDDATVRGLVAAGAGVAVVPRLMTEPANGDVAIIELDERLPPRRIALSWRSDTTAPPTLDAFVEAVDKTCAELGLHARTRVGDASRLGAGRTFPAEPKNSSSARSAPALSSSAIRPTR